MAGTHGASNLKTGSNIFVALVGSGLLAMGKAVKSAGLIGGFVGMLGFCILSAYTTMLLVDCVGICQFLSARDHDGSSDTYTPPKAIRTTHTDDALSHDPDQQVSQKVSPEGVEARDPEGAGLATSSQTMRGPSPHGGPDHNSEPALTYSDLMERAFGRPGRRAALVAVIVSQLGFCCVYMVFVTQNFHQLWDPTDKGVGGSWINMMLVLPLLIALSYLPSMEKLAPTSFFAVVCLLFCCGLILSSVGNSNVHVHSLSHYTPMVNIPDFPVFIGIGAFSYCLHGSALEQRRAMLHMRSFSTVLVAVMSLVTALYLAVGICAFLSFGNDVHADITDSLEEIMNAEFIHALKLCIMVALVGCYALQLYPVLKEVDAVFKDGPIYRAETEQPSQQPDQLRTPLWTEHQDGVSSFYGGNELNGGHGGDRKDYDGTGAVYGVEGDGMQSAPPDARSQFSVSDTHASSGSCWPYVLRPLIVIGTGVLARVIPFFGLFAGLVGSLSNATMAFVMPPLCYLKLRSMARAAGSPVLADDDDTASVYSQNIGINRQEEVGAGVLVDGAQKQHQATDWSTPMSSLRRYSLIALVVLGAIASAVSTTVTIISLESCLENSDQNKCN